MQYFFIFFSPFCFFIAIDYFIFLLYSIWYQFNITFRYSQKILSLFISVLFKKVIQSTLIMYGLFIVFNGMNLVLYGMINPADSNSISSYYLGKLLNSNQSHYSLTKVSLQDSLLCLVSLLLPIIWIILLLIATVFTKRHRKVWMNCQK